MISAAARQNFRMTSLGWTKAKGVYYIWSGQDVLALLKQVSQLQAELAVKPDLSPTASKAVAAIQAMLDAQSAMQAK